MPPSSRTVFVANIPFDVSEEELANVFSEAGPVSNVEIKFDPNTGKSKGYAFVHFYDEPTAASAVRNLCNVEVHGRNLRVELSSDDGGKRDRGRNANPNAGGGGGGGGGQGGRGGRDDGPPGGYGGAGGPGGYGPPPGQGGYGGPMGGPGAGPGQGPGPGTGMGMGMAMGMGMGPGMNGPGAGPGPGPVDFGMLPPGKEPINQRATDAITATLAAVPPGQMQDVMASVKTLIETSPAQARELLEGNPQLAYALFQAMLLLNLVDASVLQRIQPKQANSAPPSNAYGAPPAGFNAPPPAHIQPPSSFTGGPGGPGGYGDPRQLSSQGYRPPVPASAPAPAPVQAAPIQAPAPAAATGFDALPPQARAALATLPDEQKQQLVQVLTLPLSQVQTLAPDQQASIMALRQQFLGAA